jgi:hypothetical protein
MGREPAAEPSEGMVLLWGKAVILRGQASQPE